MRLVLPILFALMSAGVLSGCTTSDETEPIPATSTQTDPEPEPELTWVCEERPRCVGSYCEQVLIPSGVFSMGSDVPIRTDSHFPAGDERPIHPVQLDDFCIDKYEVSLERYEACVDDGRCSPEGLQYPAVYDTTVNHYPAKCSPDREVCKEYAVNAKTYWQAESFCEWAGARLCTEAEWERTANGPGGQQRIHPWGDDPPTAELVNIPSVGSGFIDPVDSHPSGQSVEGVFNLAGNVYEWVRDGYAPYQPAPNDEPLDNPVNLPASEGSEVVGRGSCFFTEPERTVTERSRFTKDFDWG
jgi:formylglycine-generating enzyme required for sulfatase activity